MNRIFALLLFASCYSAEASASDPAWMENNSPLLRGLTSYWQFEESSGPRYDRRAANNVLQSSNSVGTATGIWHNGASFDGISKFLRIADNASLETGNIDFTWSFWLKWNVMPVTSITLWGRWNTTGRREYGCQYVALTNTAPNGFQFATSSNGVNATVASSGAMTTNTWYHIICYHDSVNHRMGLIVNNATPVTNTFNGGVLATNAAFEVASNDGGSGFANATFDEMAYWKGRVLSAAEITQLYRAGLGVTFPRFQGTAALPTFNWSGFALTGTYSLATVKTNTVVLTPNGSAPVEGDLATHRYHHHTRIFNKAGKTYVAFSSSGSNEDANGQQVALCISSDKGSTWSAPLLVVASQNTFSGTGASYVVVAEDAGHSLTCLVTATNALGSTVSPPSNAVSVTAAR